MNVDVEWETAHGVRGWRPFPGCRVLHDDAGLPSEAYVPVAGLSRNLVAVMRACANRWRHPVRCDRLQRYTNDTEKRLSGRRAVRIRRFVVAQPRYVNTPHGPEVYGFRVVMPSGRAVDLDDAGVPEPLQLREAGLLEEWLGLYDVVCGDHPRGPVAEGDRNDRFERFPERNVYINELRAWPRKGGAYVTRHCKREGV